MEKIISITPHKMGGAGKNDKGEIVSLVKGKTYKILGEDKKYHKAKYLGGKDYVLKKTFGEMVKDLLKIIQCFKPS